jgi:RHS repeat-associated protein
MHSEITVIYNLRYPGQYFDSETGLNQNWKRDYDPVVGRYVESDPLGLDGGLNTYGYVGSSPIAASGPQGLLVAIVGHTAGQLLDLRSGLGQAEAAIGCLIEGTPTLRRLTCIVA